jgi:hypothetical protein
MKRLLTSILLTAFLLSGCAHLPARTAKEPSPPVAVLWISDTLYFGMSMPAGQVSDAQWKQYLADTVTPRFPGGFTAWQAEGQWRGKDGKIGREPSRVLQILHPDTKDDDVAVKELIAVYKNRFGQESVMRVRSSGEVTF